MKSPMDVIRDIRHSYQTWRLVVLEVREGITPSVGDFGPRSAKVMAQYATPFVDYQHTSSFNPAVATRFLRITEQAIADPSKDNVEALWDPLLDTIDRYAVETGNEGETIASLGAEIKKLKEQFKKNY